MSVPVTVIVAVKNEEPNIERCISALHPAESIYVVDSRSTDKTASIAQQAGAKVVQFDYTGGYPRKRQWAIENLPISTSWIMLIDADELVTPELWAEIGTAIRNSGTVAWSVLKLFHFMGQRFRFGGFSHSAVVLFRRGAARFESPIAHSSDGLDMEVHERLLVEGPIGQLGFPLIHDDFKGLQAYIDRHNKYSTWEAHFRTRLSTSNDHAVRGNLFGNIQERRRLLKLLAMRLPCESLAWFLYHYIFRLGFLEGKRGLIAAQIRRSYIQQVRAKMYELSIQR